LNKPGYIILAPEIDNSRLFKRQAPQSSSAIKAGAVVCAALLTVVLLLGYVTLRRRQQGQFKAEAQARIETTKSVPPMAQIKENEARLKGPEAVISGMVSNISSEKLEDLVLEVELRKRSSGGTEIRQVKVTPTTLNPGEDGRYSFKIVSRDWASSTILRLHSRSRQTDLAFVSIVGEKRPTERLPQNTKVVTVPRPKSSEDGFINSSDDPVVIK